MASEEFWGELITYSVRGATRRGPGRLSIQIIKISSNRLWAFVCFTLPHLDTKSNKFSLAYLYKNKHFFKIPAEPEKRADLFLHFEWCATNDVNSTSNLEQVKLMMLLCKSNSSQNQEHNLFFWQKTQRYYTLLNNNATVQAVNAWLSDIDTVNYKKMYWR